MNRLGQYDAEVSRDEFDVAINVVLSGRQLSGVVETVADIRRLTDVMTDVLTERINSESELEHPDQCPCALCGSHGRLEELASLLDEHLGDAKARQQ